MGEIRVKVKLTNAMDDELFQLGKLPEKKVRRYTAEAVVDTGAVRSVIPPRVQKKLGVRIRGEHLRHLSGIPGKVEGYNESQGAGFLESPAGTRRRARPVAQE